jgi:hypothetical protein
MPNRIDQGALAVATMQELCDRDKAKALNQALDILERHLPRYR